MSRKIHFLYLFLSIRLKKEVDELRDRICLERVNMDKHKDREEIIIKQKNEIESLKRLLETKSKRIIDKNEKLLTDIKDVSLPERVVLIVNLAEGGVEADEEEPQREGG